MPVMSLYMSRKCNVQIGFESCTYFSISRIQFLPHMLLSAPSTEPLSHIPYFFPRVWIASFFLTLQRASTVKLARLKKEHPVFCLSQSVYNHTLALLHCVWGVRVGQDLDNNVATQGNYWSVTMSHGSSEAGAIGLTDRPKSFKVRIQFCLMKVLLAF